MDEKEMITQCYHDVWQQTNWISRFDDGDVVDKSDKRKGPGKSAAYKMLFRHK